jgi:hypothetical protein
MSESASHTTSLPICSPIGVLDAGRSNEYIMMSRFCFNLCFPDDVMLGFFSYAFSSIFFGEAFANCFNWVVCFLIVEL